MHPALRLLVAPLKGGDPTLLWDEDFANQVYRYNRVRYPAITDLPLTTFTRATTKYAANSAGVLVPFAAGAPAITDAGLSVEAAATNVCLQSAAFGTTPWTNDLTAAVTANSTVAPDGTTTGDTITFGLNFGQRYQVITWSAGVTTLSVWAKTASGTKKFRLKATTGAADTLSSDFTATTTWQRFSYTFTASAGAGNLAVVNEVANLAGDVIVWGYQAEAGSIATSYIPTTTVAVTRPADVLVTADSVLSPTIVAEFTVPLVADPAGITIVWSHETPSNDRILLFLIRSTMTMYLQVYTGGVNQTSLALGVVAAGGTYRAAVRLATNDVAGSLAGAACVTDTVVTLPPLTTFFYGVGTGGSAWGSGIRRIRRYSVVKTNAELQALST